MLWGALQFPKVQSLVIHKITAALSSKLKVPVRIDRVNIHFFKTIVLNGIYIEDPKKDTLLYAKEFKVNIGLLSLGKKTINISYVGLEDAYVNIYKRKGQTDYNFGFILQAFASDTVSKKDTSKAAWKFDMGEVDLKSIRLGFYDYEQGADLSLALQKLNIDIGTLGLDEQHLKIDDIVLKGLDVKYKMMATATSKTDTTPSVKIVKEKTPGWKVSISEIDITSSGVVFDNDNRNPTGNGMDFNHLVLTSFNTSLANITLAAPDFAGEIKSLSLKEQSGFQLKNLVVTGGIKNGALHSELREFITPHSKMRDKITVDIKNLNDIAHTLGDISCTASFNKSVFAMQDILFFAPQLDTIAVLKKEKITLSGDIRGKLSKLSFLKADIALNSQNYVRGDFLLHGLPDVNELYFDIRIGQLRANGDYIQQFITKASMPVQLSSLGNIDMTLDAAGNTRDFKTKSRIYTSAGAAGFDLKIRLSQKYEPQSINGDLSTTQLNLGKLLGAQTKLGTINMHSSLSSKGVKDITLKTFIQSFQYNKYTYRNIDINGTYAGDSVNAMVLIKDSNALAEVEARVNMKKATFIYGLSGDIKKLELHKLNLYASPLALSTRISMSAQGNEMDSLRGKLVISDFVVQDDSAKYTLDSLTASADYQGTRKTLKIASPLLNVNVHGDFTYKEIPNATQHLLSHYMTEFKSNSKPAHIDSIYFDLAVGDTKGILGIFAPALTELSDFQLHGSFVEKSHILKLDGRIGEVSFNGTNIKDIQINATGDKEKLAFSYQSNTIYLNPTIQLLRPSLKGTFRRDSLHFNLALADSTSTSKLNLDGGLTYKKDTLRLMLPKLEMAIRDKKWNLPKEAMLVYAPHYLKIRNFSLSSGEQQIVVRTRDENTKRTKLEAAFIKVQLSEIAQATGITYSLEGLLDGNAEIINLMGNMGISSDLKISGLKADGHPIGDINFSAIKSENAGLLKLKTSLTGSGNELNIAGTFNMDKDVDNMDFHIDMAGLNTNSIQPFVKDIFYVLNGKVQADLFLKGSPSSPQLTGKVLFKDTHNVGITAIGTQYKIVNQSVTFTSNAVLLDNFTIQDTLNQTATVSGKAGHEFLKNFNLEMTFKADDFQFMDNSNSMAQVYGKFIADVNVKLHGPLEDLEIKLKVETRPRTNIYLNVATQKILSGVPQYISFVTFHKDTSGFQKTDLDSNKRVYPELDLSRFNISGTMTITKDAVVNLILNPSSGDKIVARGDGKFRLKFDSNNDLNLFGQYIIDQGSYGLSFAGVVKRNFVIDKGSSINLYGDPAAGEMDIAAIYRTRTSRFDIVSDQVDIMSKGEISAAKQRLPVDVYLKLKGGFMKPDISFDIKVPESTNSSGVVAERINQIRSDESQLNKQVFGLIIMNKFFPYQGGFSGSGGNSSGTSEQVASTVGSVLSDQLNRLGEEYLGGIQLEVNSETQNVDNNVSNNVSVMASKQVNDRLKIGVGGKSNVNNQGSTTGLAGEYEIDYSLNKTGSIGIRLFSTSQQNIYNNSNMQISGLSLNHSKSFNNLRELFRGQQHGKDLGL